MRSLPLVACVSVLALAPVATAAPDRAESTHVGAAVTSSGHASDPEVMVGFAINSPLSWMTTGALGGSAYLGFGQHHAIRANVAKYAYSDAAGTLVGDVFFGGDGSDASLSGSTFDLGLAYQYFPRRLFDVLSLEVGALRRAIDHHTVDEFDSPEDERITATGWGVRAMIGYLVFFPVISLYLVHTFKQ